MSFSVDDALSTAGDSLEVAASILWKLDENRLDPSADYRLDLQDRKEGYGDDAASYPLVEFIAEDVWERPTFGLFKKLLDNYTAETGVPEHVSEDERIEEDNFLAAISETPCIQFVYQWLCANGQLEAGSMDEFIHYMREIWFHHYSRDGARDSSGFEHVFCGELDDGKVKGLHNFFQVHVEEARGHLNYKGFLDIRGEEGGDVPPPSQQMVIVSFDWLGESKTCSSMFVGVSPEFEFALYTLLYAMETEELEVELGPYMARIKVYQMDGKIGTAFPELLGVDYDKLRELERPLGEDFNEAPPPEQDDFPPLGEAPEPPPQEVSYAEALGGGDQAEGAEQEGGTFGQEGAPGTEQDAEGGYQGYQQGYYQGY